MIALVYGTIFTYTTSPKFVRHMMDRFVDKWGTDLDANAPKAVRHRARQFMVKFGTPGTPI